MDIISIGLIVIGLIIAIIGSVQFMVAEFRISFWWLIGGFVFPIIDFVFLCVHFDEAWPGTKKWLVGFVLLAAGTFLHS